MGEIKKGLTQTFLPQFNLSPSTISIIFQPEIQEDILSQQPAPPPGSSRRFPHPLRLPQPQLSSFPLSGAENSSGSQVKEPSRLTHVGRGKIKGM